MIDTEPQPDIGDTPEVGILDVLYPGNATPRRSSWIRQRASDIVEIDGLRLRLDEVSLTLERLL